MFKRFLFLCAVAFVLLSSSACGNIDGADSTNLENFALYLEDFIQHIAEPIESAKELDDFDYLFPYLETQLRNGSFKYAERGYMISEDEAIEALFGMYGLGIDILNKYKTALNDYFIYDEKEQLFYFTGLIPASIHNSGYKLSPDNIDIVLKGNKITARVLLHENSNYLNVVSAEYIFEIVVINDNTYYRFKRIDIYEDTRFINNSCIIELEGEKISSGMYTITQNGKTEYKKLHNKLYQESLEIIPNEVDSKDLINYDNTFVYNGTLYLSVNCGGIYDTYIYNPETKSGYYMSGAESLIYNYADLINLLKDNGDPCNYYLNLIVSLHKDQEYAILRRSKIIGEIEGEYYLYNLDTMEEIYICDSYILNIVSGTKYEYCEWIDENHFYIHTLINEEYQVFYNADYDGETWIITKTESPWLK